MSVRLNQTYSSNGNAVRMHVYSNGQPNVYLLTGHFLHRFLCLKHEHDGISIGIWYSTIKSKRESI